MISVMPMLILSAAMMQPQNIALAAQPEVITQTTVASSSIPEVPFYSQFKDITSPSWQKVGCGIASVAMVIDYYKPAVPVNTLLKQGIASGAYLSHAGWTHKGLIDLAKRYGLDGKSIDLGKSDSKTAFNEFKKQLKNGPLIASVHYKFDPKSTIPHLVVINSIEGEMLSYNDPAAKEGAKKISVTDFLKAWKKRFIVIKPSPPLAVAL